MGHVQGLPGVKDLKKYHNDHLQRGCWEYRVNLNCLFLLQCFCKNKDEALWVMSIFDQESRNGQIFGVLEGVVHPQKLWMDYNFF